MSSRSSCSITSSSAAASARASSSSSDTNGPSFRPLPGRITLVSPMRPRDSTRSGQKRLSSGDRPGRDQRRLLGVLDGPGLRCGLGQHEHDHHVDERARRPRPTRRRAGRRRSPVSVACTSLAHQHHEQHGVEEPLGVRDQPQQPLAPGRPSSTRAWALVRLMRVSAVSARARNTEASSRTTMTAIITTSRGRHGALPDSGGDVTGRLGRQRRPRDPPPAGRGDRRAARARGPASARRPASSAWSRPSRWRMPCTTSRASSSS